MKNQISRVFKIEKKILFSAITSWVINTAVNASACFPLKSRILKTQMLLLFIFTALSAAAQPVIPLNNIKKIVLERKLSLEGFYRLQLQLVPVRGEWKCYQAHLTHLDDKTGKSIEDTTKIFLKNVPVADVSALLNAIASADTSATSRSLRLDSAKMVSQIDSLVPGLTGAHKQQFIKALNDQKNIARAFHDRTYNIDPNSNERYKIIIVTKSDLSITLSSSYTGFYNLPWQHNNTPLYNREITTAFYTIFNPEYRNYNEINIGPEILKTIYFKFSFQFSWEDFKAQYPSSYSILNDTIAPRYFYFNKDKCDIWLRSSALPSYTIINTSFAPADTQALRRIKRYEDTLAGFFKKDNFLFSYVLAKHGRYLSFTPGKNEKYKNKLLRELARLYPEVSAYKYSNAQLLEVSGIEENSSYWLLLPDNKLVLWQVWAKSTGNDTLEFMGRTFANVPEFDGVDDGMALYSFFIIFDASGKIIKRSLPIDPYTR